VKIGRLRFLKLLFSCKSMLIFISELNEFLFLKAWELSQINFEIYLFIFYYKNLINLFFIFLVITLMILYIKKLKHLINK